MTAPAMDIGCSAVILAGGLNSRMAGRRKAFLEVGGRTILDRLVEALGGIFGEVLLVTREPALYEGLSLRVVADIHDGRSSLTGIHAGLFHCRSPFAFVVPCDTPFLQAPLVRRIVGEITPGADVIVPLIDGRYEPLCAVYSKRCLSAIEAQLERGCYRIFDFFEGVRLETLSAGRIREVDPDLLSFFNVNTPDDLARSRRIGAPESPKETTGPPFR